MLPNNKARYVAPGMSTSCSLSSPAESQSLSPVGTASFPSVPSVRCEGFAPLSDVRAESHPPRLFNFLLPLSCERAV